eukprot:scaffold42688_cov61-Phaeocystis_antarctica.AAC.7
MLACFFGPPPLTLPLARAGAAGAGRLRRPSTCSVLHSPSWKSASVQPGVPQRSAGFHSASKMCSCLLYRSSSGSISDKGTERRLEMSGEREVGSEPPSTWQTASGGTRVRGTVLALCLGLKATHLLFECLQLLAAPSQLFALPLYRLTPREPC